MATSIAFQTSATFSTTDLHRKRDDSSGINSKMRIFYSQSKREQKNTPIYKIAEQYLAPVLEH